VSPGDPDPERTRVVVLGASMFFCPDGLRPGDDGVDRLLDQISIAPLRYGS
jgi:hypothetical protein